jgi:hypothetical protein
VRGIDAPEILESKPVVDVKHGVLAGDRSLVDADFVVRCAADADRAPAR